MAASSLQLILILLVFSHIIALNAAPITRSGKLFHDIQTQGLLASENIHEEIAEETVGEDLFMHGRMDLENNDYPGSGANNRHTPKPPVGRG